MPDPFPSQSSPSPSEAQFRRLLHYVADLELEVDRLRRRNHLVHQEARAAAEEIQRLGTAPGEPGEPTALAEIFQAANHLAVVLKDLQEAPGYHPAYDQVIAVAVRPLAEQVFRWQQRLLGAPTAVLRLELESEYVEWFPVRLRHILDNLISNALKYRDQAKTESWVQLGLRVLPNTYEFHVSDNGVGMPPGDRDRLLELFYRAAPARAAGLGVGLAVVKLLVEQSGGTLRVDSGEGQGTKFVAILPRYETDDFLT